MTHESAASGPAQDGPGHVDPDRLADLAEGLLDTSAAEEVRGHLASCELCAEDFALITLDSGLAGFLVPEPIPAEVVARVEAALYREPPLRGTSSAAAASHSASPRAAVRPPRARRFKLAFGALASVALLVGGTFVGVSMFSGGGVGESTASKAAPAAGRQDTGGGTSGNAPAVADPTAQIQQQAAQLLSALRSGEKTSGSTAASGGHPDNALQTPSLAGACPPNPRPAETLLASASTTYQGKAAELFVYAKTGDATHAHVVVVDATCGAPLHPGSATQSPRPVAGTAPLTPYSDSLTPQVLAETDVTRP